MAGSLPAIGPAWCASSVVVSGLANSPSRLAKGIEPELRAVNVPGDKGETVFPRPGCLPGKIY